MNRSIQAFIFVLRFPAVAACKFLIASLPYLVDCSGNSVDGWLNRKSSADI
jgi:hypothetical protein